MSVMNDGTFNIYDYNGFLYIGNGTSINGNGVYKEGIVDAKLPRYFNDVKIYGTWGSCFEGVLTLKSIFVPKTYRVINNDFCPGCPNLESVVFEETSEIESIGSFVVQSTAITTITLPSSLKKFSSRCAFRSCSKLKQIIFMGRIVIESDFEMFKNVPTDIIINVGKKIPFENIWR